MLLTFRETALLLLLFSSGVSVLSNLKLLFFLINMQTISCFIQSGLKKIPTNTFKHRSNRFFKLFEKYLTVDFREVKTALLNAN